MNGKQKLYETFHNIIQDHSYDEITIKDFISIAGVNRNTFYYHFPDMDSFLKEYLDDSIFIELSKLIIENKLSLAYDALIDFVSKNKKTFINIMQNQKGIDVIEYAFHTSIRMNIQKILYDYEPILKIHLPDEFMIYFAHDIADEYLKAIKLQIYNNVNPEMLKKLFVLYAESISPKLVRISRAGVFN